MKTKTIFATLFLILAGCAGLKGGIKEEKKLAQPLAKYQTIAIKFTSSNELAKFQKLFVDESKTVVREGSFLKVVKPNPEQREIASLKTALWLTLDIKSYQEPSLMNSQVAEFVLKGKLQDGHGGPTLSTFDLTGNSKHAKTSIGTGAISIPIDTDGISEDTRAARAALNFVCEYLNEHK